ncbi:hypothetical protein D6D06_07791 [Aureobasidium pullulans]|nr:hypothetical protein D6D06_07791 [Aureobasidium pullulans]
MALRRLLRVKSKRRENLKEAKKDFYDLFPAPSSTSQLLSRAYQLSVTDPLLCWLGLLSHSASPQSNPSHQAILGSFAGGNPRANLVGNPMTNLQPEERMAMIDLLHDVRTAIDEHKNNQLDVKGVARLNFNIEDLTIIDVEERMDSTSVPEESDN